MQCGGPVGFRVQLCHDIAELWRRFYGVGAILIDIPIGLAGASLQSRACDVAVRSQLGWPRSSSVFSPPCREALRARNYVEACTINQRITGRKLSRQAYGILPKIREVDDFLLGNVTARHVFHETHPELCFYVLNQGRPMKYGKKSHNGFRERMRVLVRCCPDTGDVFEQSRKMHSKSVLGDDDILDSLVNAVVALRGQGRYTPVPERPEHDSVGLDMAIWC